MALDTLIFAIDGVLAETHEARREAYNDVFREAGLKWNWDQARYAQLLKSAGSGDLILEFANPILSACRHPRDFTTMIAAMNRRHEALFNERVACRQVAMRPGVAKFLPAAARAGIRFAIVTNERESTVSALLSAELTPRFAASFDIVTAADLPRGEDQSMMHTKAVELLGLSPPTCLVIESTARGLKSALAARLPVVLTWGIYAELQECGDTLLDQDHAALAAPSSAIVGRWDCVSPADLLDHLREIHATQVRINRPHREFILEPASI